MADGGSLMLVQYDCGDRLCTPHVFCQACRTLTCRHTLDYLVAAGDVRAAIAALPRPEPGWPVTRVEVSLWTCPSILRAPVVGWLVIHRAEQGVETRALGLLVSPN